MNWKGNMNRISAVLTGAVLMGRLIAASSVMAGEWPGWQGDASHSGFTPLAVRPPLTQKWVYDAGGPIVGSPVKYGFMVYAATADGNVAGLHAQTGFELWTHSLGEPISGAPAVSKQAVVAVGESGTLAALDPLQGRLLWTASLGGETLGSPTISGDQVFVAVGSPVNGLSAIDLETGSVNWTADLGQPTHSSPSVSNGVVWLGADDGKYYGIDADTGAPVGSVTTEGLIYTASPAIFGGAAFGAGGDYDLNVYAWSADTGGLSWTAGTGVSDSFVKISSVAADGQRVYVSAGYPIQKLHALDAVTGSLLWTAEIGDITGSLSASSPAVSGDAVYIGTSDGALLALDAASGASNGSVPLDGPVIGAPAIGDGLLYVGTKSGSLYGFYGTDAGEPVVEISSPGENGLANGNIIPVTGAVRDDNLESYDLEFGAGQDPQLWELADSGHDAVQDDLIGYVNVDGMPDGDYGVRVTARDQNGNSRSASRFFWLDNTPPAFAGLAAAEDLGLGGSVKLTWAPAADDTGPIEYRVYFAPVSGGQNFSLIPYVATGTEIVVGNLTEDQPYWFVVRAADALGNEEKNTVEVQGTPTDFAVDNDPPVFAGVASVADVGDGRSLLVEWAAAEDPSTPIVYNIYAAAVSGGWDFNSPALSVASATSATVTGLTLGQTYHVVVRAEDSEGNEDANLTERSAAVTDSTPPSIVVTSIQDGFKTNQASLTVAGATDDPEAALTVDGTEAALDAEGNFSVEVAASEGAVSVSLRAEDLLGNANTLTLNGEADFTAPQLTVLSPEDGARVGGQTTVTGSAGDAHFKSVTVEYGATHQPEGWTQISSSTSPTASGELAVWDASDLGGPYSLRITAADDFGNQTQTTLHVEAYNSAEATGTLKSGQWSLVAIPIEPDPATNKTTDIFGDGEYKIWRWDPDSPDDPVTRHYVYPETVSAGDAVLIKPLDGDLSYAIQGHIADTTAPKTLSLAEGWNLVGLPYNRAYVWEDALVTRGDSTVLDAREATDGSILADALYYTENGAYAAAGPNATLQAGMGYWVKAYEAVDLSFDPNARAGWSSARIVKPRVDFRLSLTARAGSIRDALGEIGVAAGSSDLKDSRDRPKPPAMPGPYVGLSFPHRDWEGAFGDVYASDFRAPLSQGESKTWDILVETTENGKTTTLEWSIDGLPGGDYLISLIDEVLGIEVDMTARDRYEFTAEAGGRSFRIVLSLRSEEEETTLAKVLQEGWSLLAVPLDPRVSDAASQLADDLPRMDVFQFYDGRFDSVHTEGGVDIQSGIGYWVHAAAPVEIDVQGVPTDPDWPVKVPLERGWNLLGNPYAEAIDYADNLTVVYGGASWTLSQAVEKGLVSETAYGFDGAEYVPLDSAKPIEAWTGFFVRAKAPCEMIFKP